jgi:phosphonate transport system substrate-binding protein
MGFVPAENSDVVQSRADDLTRILKEKTGLNIKIFIAASYNTLIEAMKSKQIDFGWFPPFAMVKAEVLANAELLLKTVKDGKDYYYSAIFVREDSGINSIEDLRGKTIAWTQPGSAGGYVFPRADLIKKGILKDDNDKTYFGNELNAGGHDAVVLSVYNKKVDAGATFANDTLGNDGAWTRFLKDPAQQKEIKVIYYTSRIPLDAFAVRKDFREKNPMVVEKIADAIVGLYDTPEGKEVLKIMDREKVVRAKNEDYDVVRDAGRILNIEVK